MNEPWLELQRIARERADAADTEADFMLWELEYRLRADA